MGFYIAGFSILFALMDPVPYQVKVVFHAFGGISFAYGISQAVVALHAQECVSNILQSGAIV